MNSAPAAVIPFVRKITPKSVSEILKLNLLQLPRPVVGRNLYDLFGLVIGATIKPDRSGTKADSVQFKGQFQAVDCETGEVLCESGIMYIPIMDSVLYSSIRDALEKDPKARIAIAFRIALKTAPADKPSMTGYEFDVQRLIPQAHTPDDPISQLKALAKSTQLALAAPPAPLQQIPAGDALKAEKARK